MPTPRALPLAAIGLVVVAAFALVELRRPGARPSVPEPTTSAPSQALEARVRQLEWRVHELERLKSQPSASTELVGPPAPALVAAPPSAPPSRPRMTEEQEAAARMQYFEEVESRLAAEPRDENWALDVEGRLRGYARVGPAGFSVDDARCGRSLCRVQLHLGDASPGHSALQPFLSAAAGLLPEAVVRSGEQPGRAVVYFARQAGAFPSPSTDPVAAVAR